MELEAHIPRIRSLMSTLGCSKIGGGAPPPPSHAMTQWWGGLTLLFCYNLNLEYWYQLASVRAVRQMSDTDRQVSDTTYFVDYRMLVLKLLRP